jgi:DnaD/phage-associated family protein
MDQILLCSNHIPLTTSIHNSFIKDYMLDANGSYVKVYLYLSMCIQSGEQNLSISSLADRMENTEKDIIRALFYWEKKGILILQKQEPENTIIGIEMVNPDTTVFKEEQTLPQDAVPTVPEEKTAAAAKSALPADREISVTEEQTLRLAQDENFSWTCLIVENYLKRTLKQSEVQLLTYLFDTLHFSKELILHLYEYCCSLEKTNVKYVQAVALSWAEQNITTPEQAQQHSMVYSTAHTAIARALALGRPLAKIEGQYVDRWQNSWQMDLAVILEACNRTMLAIQKADFKYIDGILSKWHQENVHTLQDIKACDEKHNRQRMENHSSARAKPAAKNNPAKKTQFQSFQQRSTSQQEIDELEKMLLTR